MLPLRVSPRVRLAASSVFLLALVVLGMAVAQFNADMLRSAGWHLEARQQQNNRWGCQYYVLLKLEERPAWLGRTIHWSAQDRVRTAHRNRLLMTLYMSGQGRSLFVMGLVSTYDTLPNC